jgi:hypothetical protein
MLGIVEATIIGVTLFLAGGDLVGPVVIITFLGAFIPIIGAFLAAVIAVLVALVTGGVGTAVIVAIVAFVVQQLDNDLLAPVIYGRALSLHPVSVLLSVVAGGALFGLAGTVLAVPVVAVVVNVWKELRAAPASEQEVPMVAEVRSAACSAGNVFATRNVSAPASAKARSSSSLSRRRAYSRTQIWWNVIARALSPTNPRTDANDPPSRTAATTAALWTDPSASASTPSGTMWRMCAATSGPRGTTTSAPNDLTSSSSAGAASAITRRPSVFASCTV